MPALERLYQSYKDRWLVLVAVSLDTDSKLVAPFVHEQKLTFPIALDPKAEVANKYGVRALPSSFVVDRKGTMAALALGPRTWDNAAAKALGKIMGELQGDSLTRNPKGFDSAHPAGDLIRRKAWFFASNLPPETAESPKLLSEIVKRFRAASPVIAMLNA